MKILNSMIAGALATVFVGCSSGASVAPPVHSPQPVLKSEREIASFQAASSLWRQINTGIITEPTLVCRALKTIKGSLSGASLALSDIGAGSKKFEDIRRANDCALD